MERGMEQIQDRDAGPSTRGRLGRCRWVCRVVWKEIWPLFLCCIALKTSPFLFFLNPGFQSETTIPRGLTEELGEQPLALVSPSCVPRAGCVTARPARESKPSITSCLWTAKSQGCHQEAQQIPLDLLEIIWVAQQQERSWKMVKLLFPHSLKAFMTGPFASIVQCWLTFCLNFSPALIHATGTSRERNVADSRLQP